MLSDLKKRDCECSSAQSSRIGERTTFFHEDIFEEAPESHDTCSAGSLIAIVAEFPIIAGVTLLAVMDLDPGPGDHIHVVLVVIIVAGKVLHALPVVLAISELIEPLSVRIVVVLGVERTFHVLFPVYIGVRTNE